MRCRQRKWHRRSDDGHVDNVRPPDVADDGPPGRGPTPKRVFARPRIVVAESCAVDVHADVYAIGDTANVDYGLDYCLDYGLDYDDYHNDYD